MNALTFERALVRAIAWLTVVTGAIQIIAPEKMLAMLHVAPDAAVAHLFATVGMFMVVVGAAVAHALASPPADRIVLLWGALQKMGAALLVGLAVSEHVFRPLALLVAAIDFASGVLFFDLRRRGAP
jgi:hypothetical protein